MTWPGTLRPPAVERTPGDEGPGAAPPENAGTGDAGPLLTARSGGRFLSSPGEWVCVAAAFLLVVATTRDFFLFGDDYAFLGQARRSALDVAYLRADLFGHFSPVSRLVDHLAANTFAGVPAAEPVMLLLLVLVTQLSIAYLVHLCVPSRPVALVGTFLASTSVTLVSLAHWWTAGLNILPGVAGSALCLAGAVTALRDHSRRGMVLSVAAYVVACLSWELSLLMPAYVLAFAVLLVWRGPLRHLVSEVRRTLPLWLGLVLVGAAFALNYVTGYSVPLPRAPLVDYAAGLYISLVVTVIPAVVGVFVTGNGVVAITVRALLVLLLAALVRITLRGRDGVGRAWLFALLGWLLPSGVLVASRVGVHGPWVATLPFYFLMPVVLTTLGVAISVSPTVERAVAAVRPTRRGRWVRAGGAGLVFLAVWIPSAAASGTIITTFSATIQRVTPPTGDYVENLRTSAASAFGGASGRPAASPISVINGDVPPGLVAKAYAPYNRLDWVAEVNGIRLDIDRFGRSQYLVDDDGHLRPAVEDVRYTHTFGPSDVALVENASQVAFTSAKGLCFVPTTSASSVRLALPQTVYGSRLVLTTELSVDRTTSRRIVGAPSLSGPLDVVSYDAKTWTPDARGAVDAIRYTTLRLVSIDGFDPGTRVCLRGVRVAQVDAGS